jgi:peptidoglycan/LPS O-acetylase OafA/YrhL
MSNTKTRNVWLAVGLSVLIGVGVWEGIGRVTGVEAWDHGAYWWVGYPLMIIAAGALGFMFPRRPWRWGALIIGAQLVWSFIGAAGQAVLLPFTLLIFIALGIPCVLASYLGAWLTRKFRPATR